MVKLNTHRRGFTLVELLVVISIITILIALLLPALSASREQANRVRCAANLHVWGQACFNFAADNRGYFPVAWHHAAGVVFPSQVPFDQSYRGGYPLNPSGVGTDAWKTYGTEIPLWNAYGLGTQGLPTTPPAPAAAPGLLTTPTNSMTCPSSAMPVSLWTYSDQQWGTCCWSNYMYVGGLTATTIGGCQANWGTGVPAVHQYDNGNSTRVLAADEVYWAAGHTSLNTYNGGFSYRINHLDLHSATPTPAFQNILYGDGHVSALTKSDYPKGLLSGTGNWSLYYNLNGGPYWYWSGNQYGTPVTPQ